MSIFLPKYQFFYQNIIFLPKYQFFYQNISFFTKISFFYQNVNFFYQNISFLPKSHFFTKMSIFDQNFHFFWWKSFARIRLFLLLISCQPFSQETWRQLFPRGGVEMVQKYLPSFSSFYISQIRADNHAVREAACACIAELASKCSEESLEARVVKLRIRAYPVKFRN